MIKILFVCLGNICRSPSAEYMFKKMIAQRNLDNHFYCESKATSAYEIGAKVYHLMNPYLLKRGINASNHIARQIQQKDYDNFDLILCMDYENLHALKHRFKDEDHKIYLLNEYVGLPGIISDPWYHENFDQTLNELETALDLLIKKLVK